MEKISKVIYIQESFFEVENLVMESTYGIYKNMEKSLSMKGNGVMMHDMVQGKRLDQMEQFDMVNGRMETINVK